MKEPLISATSVRPSPSGQEFVNELTSPRFLRNTWYVAGWASDFADREPVSITLAGEPIVLFRTASNTVSALANRCPHRWAPLSLGRVEGEGIRCMYHGLKFDAGGKCTEVPGQDRIPRALGVRSYPIIQRHRLVWLWTGEPSRADPALIPDLSLLDQPNMRVYTGHLDYRAHYSLINDNLLDLSHLAFLHEQTIGRPVGTSTLRPHDRFPGGSEAQPLERGVRVEGWLSGKTVFVPRKVRGGDFWSRVDFSVPGIYHSHGRMYEQGTAEACQGREPASNRKAISESFSIQAVTPISARQTRYFYSFGARMSDMDQEEADAMWQIILQAFAEDLRMIEAQQELMDTHPGTRMAGILADRGLVHFRRLIKQLLANEAGGQITVE